MILENGKIKIYAIQSHWVKSLPYEILESRQREAKYIALGLKIEMLVGYVG